MADAVASHVPNGHGLSRRHFLRGVGVSIALPWMETLSRAAEPVAAQRFVCFSNAFGMLQSAFFPAEDGLQAALPKNLTAFAKLRGKFTVISNIDHGINEGHGGSHMFLSGVRSAEAPVFPDGNISLDQFLAQSVAGKTRFPVINTATGPGGAGGLCWTRTGVAVPPIYKVSRIFKMLFMDDPADQLAGISADYDEQGSILDAVNGKAKSINQRLSARDRAKFDQYLTAVRETEQTIQQQKAWLSRPRPKVGRAEPTDGPPSHQLPILFDLLALALETDSTRVATLQVTGDFDEALGLPVKTYHGYTHHGKDPTMMEGLRKIEGYQMIHLAKFLEKLDGLGLLDTTQVLFGSGMGDGNAHTGLDLPILLAGGGYKHCTHRILPAERHKRIPLSNLYLTMAHRFGVEAERFGRSTGTFDSLS
jgi:hypothetical protein